MSNLDPQKKALWQKRVSDWKQSAQSARSWCKSNNLTYSTFIYWKDRYKEAESLLPPTGFTELSLESPSSTDTGIELYCGQIKICLQRDFDEPTLRRLLAFLGRAV